ncbi:hypothetical protein Bbelb_288380 [Branchiostoma belcheri]|nr:hypothetical protein Bbelb_288380 [Branchiostoma belcheri]
MGEGGAGDICGECGYRTALKSTLFRHMRTHTGEKPYKCDHGQCDYSTAWKSDLDRHVAKHTGEKPYKCDQCDYSAARKANLDKHLTKHTGEKPYMCGECGYGTVYKAFTSDLTSRRKDIACCPSSGLREEKNRHRKKVKGDKDGGGLRVTVSCCD